MQIIIDVDSDREATEAIFQAIQGVLGLVTVPTFAAVVWDEESQPANTDWMRCRSYTAGVPHIHDFRAQSRKNWKVLFTCYGCPATEWRDAESGKRVE